ncbi:MAG: tetraacyldisaccharide 4'-kinase [Alphaproteobacteria bacterium]|nr:tetraacyldisaccharide 4'-kinase [Alphaproteobacteria bacterium]
MKTPSFWYKDKPDFMARLLSPLGALYQWADRYNYNRTDARRAPLPVLCVGNINAGGSGKTPTVVALFKLLQDYQLAKAPAFLLRGYHSRVVGPCYVEEAATSDQWGDEAVLLSDIGPTIVAQSRYDGACLAARCGQDIVVLDDGLQHYDLAKDISFCVVDGAHGFGNGLALPSGPLRVTFEDAIPAIDAFIVIGDPTHSSCSMIFSSGKPVFRAALRPTNLSELSLDQPYFGFCGIGLPQKFKSSLQDCGVKLVGFESFADHHAYSFDDLAALGKKATALGARLITTSKDAVRLVDFPQKSLVDELKVSLVWEDQIAVVDFIRGRLSAS